MKETIRRSPPEKDCIKLNVDGSLNPETGCIAAGGVIRNHLKTWIGGFALNKGLGSIIEAELWGIFEGLQLLWKAGYKKVIVESDSQASISLLMTDTSTTHPLYSIIMSCKALLDNNWCCCIRHVCREGNRVADGLARMGHSLELGLQVFEEPPLQIHNILEDDFRGLAIARRFCSASV